MSISLLSRSPLARVFRVVSFGPLLCAAVVGACLVYTRVSSGVWRGSSPVRDYIVISAAVLALLLLASFPVIAMATRDLPRRERFTGYALFGTGKLAMLGACWLFLQLLLD